MRGYHKLNIMLRRCCVVFIFLLIANYCRAQAAGEEANLKAAFIFNFTKYIDWETSNTEQDFVIGVIGNTPVAQSLEEVARSRTTHDKKISIRKFSRPEDIVSCQVLFIPKNCPFSLVSVLEHTGRGVLTVSEENGFAKLGTALNFIEINDKLRFEANLRSLYVAGLRAGSQLLRLAIIVD
jgi:hypothetical protein